MELVLVRHAESAQVTYMKRDIERHLTAKGYDEAAQSALRLKSLGFKPDLILCSPAVRTYTTALVFAASLNYEVGNILIRPEIYEAPLVRLLGEVNLTGDHFRKVVMFCHNPGITRLTNHLCGDVCAHIPPAGMAVIGFSLDSWREVSGGTGRLMDLYV